MSNNRGEGKKLFFCFYGEKQKNILFLGSLAEIGSLIVESLSFAHSSLIVRSTFA